MQRKMSPAIAMRIDQVSSGAIVAAADTPPLKAAAEPTCAQEMPSLYDHSGLTSARSLAASQATVRGRAPSTPRMRADGVVIARPAPKLGRPARRRSREAPAGATA